MRQSPCSGQGPLGRLQARNSRFATSWPEGPLDPPVVEHCIRLLMCGNACSCTHPARPSNRCARPRARLPARSVCMRARARHAAWYLNSWDACYSCKYLKTMPGTDCLKLHVARECRAGQSEGPSLRGEGAHGCVHGGATHGAHRHGDATWHAVGGPRGTCGFCARTLTRAWRAWARALER